MRVSGQDGGQTARRVKGGRGRKMDVSCRCVMDRVLCSLPASNAVLLLLRKLLSSLLLSPPP